jgi:hypothetical protein
VRTFSTDAANGDVQVVEFLHDDLQDAIIFERPRELADRLAGDPAVSLMNRAAPGDSA